MVHQTAVFLLRGRHLPVHLDEPGLHAARLAHVADDDAASHDPTSDIMDRRDRQQHIHQAAVLVQVSRLVLFDDVALRHAPQQVVGVRGFLGMRQDGDRTPHHLLLQVAEHLLRGAVPALHPSVQSDGGNGIAGGRDESLQVVPGLHYLIQQPALLDDLPQQPGQCFEQPASLAVEVIDLIAVDVQNSDDLLPRPQRKTDFATHLGKQRHVVRILPHVRHHSDLAGSNDARHHALLQRLTVALGNLRRSPGAPGAVHHLSPLGVQQADGAREVAHVLHQPTHRLVQRLGQVVRAQRLAADGGDPADLLGGRQRDVGSSERLRLHGGLPSSGRSPGWGADAGSSAARMLESRNHATSDRMNVTGRAPEHLQAKQSQVSTRRCQGNRAPCQPSDGGAP